MSSLGIKFLWVVLFIFSCNPFRHVELEKIKYSPSLRYELLQMREEDQKMRRRIREESIGPDATEFWEEFHKLDEKHTERLKEIIKQYGWPRKSLVGEDGAFAAWLIVQHATHDLNFQKHCLKLMKKEAKRGEVPLQCIAYLIDRIRILEGKPQVYGTQYRIVNGELEFLPIEDEANVDKRRKEMGLPPLSEYMKQIKGKK